MSFLPWLDQRVGYPGATPPISPQVGQATMHPPFSGTRIPNSQAFDPQQQQPQGGLLGWFNNPITQMGLGLLSSNTGNYGAFNAMPALQHTQRHQAFLAQQQAAAQQQALLRDRAEQEEEKRKEERRTALARQQAIQNLPPEMQKWIQAGVPVKDIYGTNNRKPGTYGNTPIFGMQDGRLTVARFAPGGGLHVPQMPEGFSPVKPYTHQELGGSVGHIPYGQPYPIGYSPKTLPPQQEPAVKQAQAEATARGSAEGKIAGTETKRTAAAEGQAEKARMLGGLIDRARDQAGFWTTGMVGSVTQGIPGTPGFDLSRTLDTVKANIGFDRLQEMRDNSPTGGALGQVSEFENRLLQSVWGNLEQSQSKEQFLENLDLVEEAVEASWRRVAAAYEQDYGRPLDLSFLGGNSASSRGTRKKFVRGEDGRIIPQ